MLNNSTKQKDLFKVPDNYFENFNARIMDELPEKKVAKIVPLWKKVLPWTAVAAVVCGVVFSVGIFNRKSDAIAEHSRNKGAGQEVNKNITTTSSEEEDFYRYLEEEATMSSYRDIMYNDN